MTSGSFGDICHERHLLCSVLLLGRSIAGRKLQHVFLCSSNNCILGPTADTEALLQAPGPKDPASYSLNFLWLDKNVAVSVDQVFSKVRRRVCKLNTWCLLEYCDAERPAEIKD